MTFKEFIKPDAQKVVLSIFTFLFASMFFFFVGVMGFAPPFQLLSVFISGWGLYEIILIIAAILHLGIYYLFVCLVIWLINKTPTKKVQWTIIIVICILLVGLSFIDGIYRSGDLGGGSQKSNILGLLKLSSNDRFCREKCENKDGLYFSSLNEHIKTLRCVCNNREMLNFDSETFKELTAEEYVAR